MSQAAPASSVAEGALPNPGGVFWRETLAPYARPRLDRSVIDLATSVVPYLALSFLMYRTLGVSYWLVLLIAIPASGFLVRTFILFHDCSHGSFMASRRSSGAPPSSTERNPVRHTVGSRWNGSSPA